MFSRLGGSALALAALVACSSNKVSSGSASVTPAAAPLTLSSVVGEYALVSVDGRALPYTPRAAAGTTVRPVVSGTFLLNANGTFRLQTVYGPSNGGTSTPAVVSGACYTEGDEVKMMWDEGGSTNMTMKGDTVTLKREGAVYAYLRTR